MSDTSPETNIERFKKLVTDIQFCMFTTMNAKDGGLSSRPMTLQQVDDANSLWFFADRSSDLTNDIRLNTDVNIAFAHPGESSYVSVTGAAYVVQDMEKIKELFSPATKAWFPDGVDDPNLTLIQCKPSSVDYWDSPSSKAVQLVAFAKSVITGEKPGDELGRHGHVDIARH